jgi:hypothetical protein
MAFASSASSKLLSIMHLATYPSRKEPTDSVEEGKIQALRCYEGEFQRTGEKWVNYLDHRSLELGIQVGSARAEAFVVYRYLWEW